MKPFNLEAAKAGEPVMTKSGLKARIICFDRKRKDDNKSLLVLITRLTEDGKEYEQIVPFNINGIYINPLRLERVEDEVLVMAPKTKKVWVTLYRNEEGILKSATSAFCPKNIPNIKKQFQIEIEDEE